MIKKFIGVFLLEILLISCVSLEVTTKQQHHTHFTKHYKESLFQTTENRLFSVELVLPERMLKLGKNDFDLIVHDRADRDLAGATLSVKGYMPEMGHSVEQSPTIKEKGGGLYHVSDFYITMPGHWQIIVKVQKDGSSDIAVFDFPQVGQMQMHHQVKRPERIDLSRQKRSEKGMYIVSYMPELEPIRINRIHSWQLTIKDSKGSPVTNASVRVEADMPEHGHGMPTEPQVVDSPEPGVYIVDGFKFHMPGWWVVKLYIKSSTGEDVVVFQLDLK